MAESNKTDLTLTFMAPCPQCGGQNLWELFQVFNQCDYCGAQLWHPTVPEAQEYLIARDHIIDADGIAYVMAQYEAMRQHSLMVGELRGGSPRDDLTVDLTAEWIRQQLPSVHELIQRYLPKFTVQESFRVYVPYYLVSMDLLYCVLGRERNGTRKVYRLMGYRIEEIFPAYHASLNFRDRGLWMTSERLRALRAEDLASNDFIPPVSDVDPSAETLRRWSRRREILKPEIDPIEFTSFVSRTRHWYVYRPYHLARVMTPEGLRWVLLDGQFGTIAGYPGEQEVQKIRSAVHTDALVDDHGVRIHLLPFRCPECGWDVPYTSNASLLLCFNCGRLLKPTPRGLHPVPYRIATINSDASPASDRKVGWFPFYRVMGIWLGAGGSTHDFQEVLKSVDTYGSLSRFLNGSSLTSLFIPAFDVFRFTGYDQWVMEMMRQLSIQNPQYPEDRHVFHANPPTQSEVLFPETVCDDLEHLIAHLAPALLPSPVQARLNPLMLKKITETHFQIQSLEMIYVRLTLQKAPTGHYVFDGTNLSWEILRDRQLPPDRIRTARRWRRKQQASTHEA